MIFFGGSLLQRNHSSTDANLVSVASRRALEYGWVTCWTFHCGFWALEPVEKGILCRPICPRSDKWHPYLQQAWYVVICLRRKLLGSKVCQIHASFHIHSHRRYHLQGPMCKSYQYHFCEIEGNLDIHTAICFVWSSISNSTTFKISKWFARNFRLPPWLVLLALIA